MIARAGISVRGRALLLADDCVDLCPMLSLTGIALIPHNGVFLRSIAERVCIAAVLPPGDPTGLNFITMVFATSDVSIISY